MIVLVNKQIITNVKKAQFVLGFLFLFISCEKSLNNYIFSGSTMGTTYTIKLNSYHTGHQKSHIEKGIDSILINLNQQMSTWIDDSEISLFNQSRTVEPHRISDEFFYVLQQGKLINKKTAGAFDYTIFPLAELWGFGPGLKEDIEIPAKSDLKKVLQYVGINKVELDYPYIKKMHPKVQIDLNAIAKGYAVDILHNWLLQRGFLNIFVEIGGEIRCSGKNIDKKNWSVGIDMPNESSIPGQEVFSIINLDNKAIATSGSYRNFRVNNGKTINHTIDPVSGYSVETDIVSVSVIADNCLSADAWATALMVLTYDEGLKKVNNDESIEAMWVVLKDKNILENFSSDGFLK